MIRLKELRQKSNISQAELSDLVGVSRSTIAMWETNKSQPDIESIRKIASVLQTTIDNLLCYDASSAQPKEAEPEQSVKFQPNTVTLCSHDGDLTVKKLTDEQMDAIRSIIEQLPGASE